MAEDNRAKIAAALGQRFGLQTMEALAVVKVPCDLTDECKALQSNTLELDGDNNRYHCTNCEQSGDLAALAGLAPARVSTRAIVTAEAPSMKAEFLREEEPQPDPEFSAAPARADARATRRAAKVSSKGLVRVLTAEQLGETGAQIHKRGRGERLIIALVALVFVIAGLGAAALSGFANYQAFANSVDDPLQSKIWGWTGVIAAIVSFGGFTLFYWHQANKRPWESLRALLFALIGAGTSILGTHLYIDANNRGSAQLASSAEDNRARIEGQIDDWRAQLAGIPPETRTVEGLTAYIAEVERLGLTDQRPYRLAKDELGLARRRDDLQGKIDAANSDLLGTGNSNILLEAEARTNIPSLFFAIILEIFSSQGTSIGLVALMLLAGRRPEPLPASRSV